MHRAVATSLVSPVSTGPLFPHSWLAWHCRLAPLLGERPCNAPKHIGTMLKFERWLQTVQQNCSASLPTTFHSYKRTISLARSCHKEPSTACLSSCMVGVSLVPRPCGRRVVSTVYTCVIIPKKTWESLYVCKLSVKSIRISKQWCLVAVYCESRK